MPEAVGKTTDLPPFPKGRVKILIVEDNPVTSEFLKERLMATPGLQADLVVREKLSTALAVLDAQKVDLVFLDLLLPDSMGVDTFARVQAAHPKVPKIVMSALEEDAVRDTLQAAGAPYFLSKSTGGLERLAPVVRRALGSPWMPGRDGAARSELNDADLDAEPDGIVLFGKGWDVRYANAAARGLLNQSTTKELAALLFDSAEIQEIFVKRNGKPDDALVRVTLGSAAYDGEAVHVLTLRPVGSR